MNDLGPLYGSKCDKFENNAAKDERKIFKTDASPSSDLCLSTPGNVLPGVTFHDGAFQKLYKNFSACLLKKTLGGGSSGRDNDDGKKKFGHWNDTITDPICSYNDASRFLKKQINRFYSRTYRLKHDGKLKEVTTEAETNEVDTNLQQEKKEMVHVLSAPFYSKQQVRSKIIHELVNGEKDYVKILTDVKRAYLTECRNSKRLFTEDDICTIYGNWEQILSLQSSFLNYLEANLDVNKPSYTTVGECFVKCKDRFYVYSYYCNNHPLAIGTLQALREKEEYKTFFENVRIKNNFPAIALDGFLLTPIQRICKYPLQLAELLKYTEPGHVDHEFVKNALKVMRDVTILINERKRRIENLEKLILWQREVEGWQGADLVEDSSQLIRQNDVSKVFTGLWFIDVTIFLFDRQLIFCKKDPHRPKTYIFQGRISLRYCEIIDVPDGKGTLLGINIRHGIKVQNTRENKWLLFCCTSHQEKLEWLSSFRDERELVVAEKYNKLRMTATDKRLARLIAAAYCNGLTFLPPQDLALLNE